MFFYILGTFVLSMIIVILFTYFYLALKAEVTRVTKLVEIERENYDKAKNARMNRNKEQEEEEDKDDVEDIEDNEENEESKCSKNDDEIDEITQDMNKSTSTDSNTISNSIPYPHSNKYTKHQSIYGQSDSDEMIDPSYFPRPLNMFPLSTQAMHNRDRNVVNDPLYPPLNRSSLKPHDNYRLIGYLVGEESVSDSWQLYGRKVNNTRSQFYARPTDRNIDMKIQIEDNMMPPRDRIRDLDNLPDTVILDHPLFTSGTYKVTENPRTDFDSFYI